MSVVLAALVGVGLGVFVGIPIGVINLAVVDAASAGRLRFAIGIGLGGALADAMHAAIAFVGVGRVLAARPDLVKTLAVVVAVVVAGYAAWSWRTRARHVALATDESRLERGVVTGLVLTLPNPGALGAWVAIASLYRVGTTAEAIAVAIGVAIGAAVWFAILARWISTVRRDHPALAVLRTVALAALLPIIVVGLVRAFW